METLRNIDLDPRLRRIEDDCFARIADVFVQCPYLMGFTLKYLGHLPHRRAESHADGEVQDLVVRDAQFSISVSVEYDDEICQFIDTILARIFAERSEAISVLRDRTFARSLH
jgi:hypothetical protein